MSERVLYVRISRPELRRRLALLPAILAGRAPDEFNIQRGFMLRLAVAFLEKVKLAFITKARGGTDEAGESWPKLSRKYLAYGRRFGRGEQAALKKAAGLGRANNRRGLLTAAQDKRWKKIYARNLAWLAARESIGEAKAHAASIAWAQLKREGAQTKLDVYGNREVEILRDTGILFNSLSPGLLSPRGADAAYSAKPNQIIRFRQGELIVGTEVPYASRHHNGVKVPQRRLWPRNIPASWYAYFTRQADAGLAKGIELLSGGRAA